jgi:DNA-binding MarR family transcriptional regulator
VEREADAGSAADQVAELLRQVMRLQRRGSPEDWTALELTMAQMKVLFLLHHEGAAKVSDLAETLGVSAPSMTGTLDRLVRGGLVERRDDPTDRRLVINVLTPDGQALVERLHQGRRARLGAALARLDPATMHTLEHGLAALKEALEEVEREARAPVASRR